MKFIKYVDRFILFMSMILFLKGVGFNILKFKFIIFFVIDI